MTKVSLYQPHHTHKKSVPIEGTMSNTLDCFSNEVPNYNLSQKKYFV